MNQLIIQCASLFTEQAKSLLSKTHIAWGAPILGSSVGVVSFLKEITPILTVVSLLVGIILGILSYRLKLKHYRKHEQEEN